MVQTHYICSADAHLSVSAFHCSSHLCLGDCRCEKSCSGVFSLQLVASLPSRLLSWEYTALSGKTCCCSVSCTADWCLKGLSHSVETHVTLTALPHTHTLSHLSKTNQHNTDPATITLPFWNHWKLASIFATMLKSYYSWSTFNNRKNPSRQTLECHIIIDLVRRVVQVILLTNSSASPSCFQSILSNSKAQHM